MKKATRSAFFGTPGFAHVRRTIGSIQVKYMYYWKGRKTQLKTKMRMKMAMVKRLLVLEPGAAKPMRQLCARLSLIILAIASTQSDHRFSLQHWLTNELSLSFDRTAKLLNRLKCVCIGQIYFMACFAMVWLVSSVTISCWNEIIKKEQRRCSACRVGQAYHSLFLLHM